MRKVELGGEDVHKLAVHALLVDALRDERAGKVLACAGPAVQREHQRLLGVGVVHEAAHRLGNDVRRQVLPEQPATEVLLQTCPHNANHNAHDQNHQELTTVSQECP